MWMMWIITLWWSAIHTSLWNCIRNEMITLNFSDCNFSDCNAFRPPPFGQTEATCLENDFGDSFSDCDSFRHKLVANWHEECVAPRISKNENKNNRMLKFRGQFRILLNWFLKIQVHCKKHIAKAKASESHSRGIQSLDSKPWTVSTRYWSLLVEFKFN